MKGFIDLHTHSLFSDGELLPSEIVVRAKQKGIKAIAITDHCDSSNIEFIITSISKACREINRHWNIYAICGIEITHVPPATITRLVKEARSIGAKIVVVHGETIVEPVPEGTNRSAIEAKVDILAHPGLISLEEVKLAKKNYVCLEITTRKGHSLTNGHVARLAKMVGANLVINTDTHSPSDLIDIAVARKIIHGAGLADNDFNKIIKNSYNLVKQRIINKGGD